MVFFPPCKINLGLNIIRKRPDGYHDLETCFYPIPWTDILEVIPARDFNFHSTGIEIPGDSATNLCDKAYRELQKVFSLPPVNIHLHKLVPTGAGLGGGSSDAAATLRLLQTLFSLPLAESQLEDIALTLGSDCPFFLHRGPMIGKGRGEILSPTRNVLDGKYLCIVKPPVHVSTADAYQAIIPRLSDISVQQVVETKPMSTWKEFLKNDFEQTVFAQFPLLAEIKETMYKHGALYASMSGSGSAVFGIFETEIRIQFPNTWNGWSGYVIAGKETL